MTYVYPLLLFHSGTKYDICVRIDKNHRLLSTNNFNKAPIVIRDIVSRVHETNKSYAAYILTELNI